MSTLSIQPLSPLDGRYQRQVSGLGEYLSEAGLNRARIQVEIEWLIALTDANLFGTEKLSDENKTSLRDVVKNFNDDDVDELAKTEAVTVHDVKAVEYFVRERLHQLGLDHI